LDTIDAQDKCTVLHWAVRNSDIPCAAILLKHGASPKIKDSNDHTPLQIAEDESCNEIVELCIKAEKARLLEEKIITILTSPKVDNNPRLRNDFKQFINDNEKKVMLDLPYADGNTALHSFAEKGFPKFAKMILEMGADVNIQNDQGSTPLHLAVISGQSFIVQEILKRKPQLDKRDEKNQTVVDIMEKYRDGYLKLLPSEHYTSDSGLLKYTEATPLDETLIDDDETSESETITKKLTSHQDEKSSKENHIESDSSDSDSLTAKEELKLEKKSNKKAEIF